MMNAAHKKQIQDLDIVFTQIRNETNFTIEISYFFRSALFWGLWLFIICKPHFYQLLSFPHPDRGRQFLFLTTCGNAISVDCPLYFDWFWFVVVWAAFSTMLGADGVLSGLPTLPRTSTFAATAKNSKVFLSIRVTRILKIINCKPTLEICFCSDLMKLLAFQYFFIT